MFIAKNVFYSFLAIEEDLKKSQRTEKKLEVGYMKWKRNKFSDYFAMITVGELNFVD